MMKNTSNVCNGGKLYEIVANKNIHSNLSDLAQR